MALITAVARVRSLARRPYTCHGWGQKIKKGSSCPPMAFCELLCFSICSHDCFPAGLTLCVSRNHIFSPLCLLYLTQYLLHRSKTILKWVNEEMHMYTSNHKKHILLQCAPITEQTHFYILQIIVFTSFCSNNYPMFYSISRSSLV